MTVSMVLGLHPWTANISDTQYLAAKRAIKTGGPYRYFDSPVCSGARALLRLKYQLFSLSSVRHLWLSRGQKNRMSIYKRVYLAAFCDTVWTFQQQLLHIEEIKNSVVAQSLRLGANLVLKNLEDSWGPTGLQSTSEAQRGWVLVAKESRNSDDELDSRKKGKQEKKKCFPFLSPLSKPSRHQKVPSTSRVGLPTSDDLIRMSFNGVSHGFPVS